MTNQEKVLLLQLIEVWKMAQNIEWCVSSDKREFAQHIHALQNMVVANHVFKDINKFFTEESS